MIAYFGQAYGIKYNTIQYTLVSNNVRINLSKYLSFQRLLDTYFMHRIEHVKFQFVKTRCCDFLITMTCQIYSVQLCVFVWRACDFNYYAKMARNRCWTLC